MTSMRDVGSRWPLSLAVLLLALGVGCGSPQSRHAVLDFFFDGVPDPDAPGTADDGSGTGEDGEPGADTRPRGSRHAPWVERACTVCHEKEFGGRAGGRRDFRSIVRGWARCVVCHRQGGAAEDAIVLHDGTLRHGPVAKGECRNCHLPHKSKHASLLRTERAETLCISCHEKHRERTGTMATLDCSACHDPHEAATAEDRFLRGGAAGHCVGCHFPRMEERPWQHGPVVKGTCLVCHDAHGGPDSDGHVIRPIRAICIRCHELPELESTHPEGLDRTCTECHDPHSARRPADLFLRDRMTRDGPIGGAFEEARTSFPRPGGETGKTPEPVEAVPAGRRIRENSPGRDLGGPDTP